MLADLAALLDVLRAKGVTSYKGDAVVSVAGRPHSTIIEVTLGPLVAPLDDKPAAKQVDPDICSCGHGVHEHNGALCLLGCDEEKCAVKP